MKYNKWFWFRISSCGCMGSDNISHRKYLSLVILGKSFEIPKPCKGCEAPF